MRYKRTIDDQYYFLIGGYWVEECHTDWMEGFY